MTCKSLILAIGLQLLALPVLAQDKSENHPLKNDPTGINWVFSLDEAIQKARETNRIVILKPVSFRSKDDSDHLSPSAESQRAISFVDSRVVSLLNRRFVPYYFDMDVRGSQYDEKASDLAKVLYPEMRYLSSTPTPPLLFMTPDKKMLGYASNFLTATELLARLLEILEENPKFKEITTAERVITNPIEKAWLHYELRELEKAVECLDKQQASEAYYLRLLIAREQSNWRAMKFAIKMVTDTHRLFDVDVENVIRYWTIGNFEGIKAKCKRITIKNPRYQEAMYYCGLAHYHTGDEEAAVATWKQAIEHNRDSAWALRLDLALGLLLLDPSTYMSAQDAIPSQLGRRYMCPNGIDDLKKRD